MNQVVIGVLNVISGLSILIIPLPILWRIRVPIRRKLALAAIFSLGYFVIIATILRAYYSLLSLDTLPTALGWASRELVCATVAACIPGIKPLFSKSHWLRSSRRPSRSVPHIVGDTYAESSKSSMHSVTSSLRFVTWKMQSMFSRPCSTSATSTTPAASNADDAGRSPVPGKCNEVHLALTERCARQHGSIPQEHGATESSERAKMEAYSNGDYVIIITDPPISTGEIGVS